MDGSNIVSRRGFLPLVRDGLLLLGLVLGGAGVFLLTRPTDQSTHASDCATAPSVDLVVDTSIYGVVARGLSDVRRRCTRITLASRDGGDVSKSFADGLAVPDVWLTDRYWMSQAEAGGSTPLSRITGPVATTPVLLVGGPHATRYPTWGDAETSGKVSTPDPSLTTTGALALSAPLAEAGLVHRTAAQTRQLLVPYAQDYRARVWEGLDRTVQLKTLTVHSPRVQVATEQDLISARDRQPWLRSLTPPTGAPALRLVVTYRPGSPGARPLARGLAAWLRGPAGVRALHAAGLRGADGAPIPGYPAPDRLLAPPPMSAVSDRVSQWHALGVPSSILAVLDVSGSMDFYAGSRTRMQLLAAASRLGLGLFPGEARVGLWVFSVHQAGARDWRVLEPTRRLDQVWHGRTQRYALQQRTYQLPGLTGGGTGLYDTALAAYRQGLRDYDERYSNVVVLMTDGANDDPGSIGLPALLTRLRALHDPRRPVRIVAIGISADADMGALRQIARATGGQAYLAADPADIGSVFAQAVLAR